MFVHPSRLQAADVRFTLNTNAMQFGSNKAVHPSRLWAVDVCFIPTTNEVAIRRVCSSRPAFKQGRFVSFSTLINIQMHPIHSDPPSGRGGLFWFTFLPHNLFVSFVF